MKRFIYLAIGFCLFSCARTPLNEIKQSMRLTNREVLIRDSLSEETFFKSLKKQIEHFKKNKNENDLLVFGEKKITIKDYGQALERILLHENDWQEYINKNFEFLEIYGQNNWSEAFITGYYEPVVQGSIHKSVKYSQALYQKPKDLVVIDLMSFHLGHGFQAGRVDSQKIIPYFSRKEIDQDEVLNGRNLEMVYVDPIDAFFIQIQGSAIIELEDGEKFAIGFDGQNGFPYVPIGKYLTDVISLKEMSMQKIKNYLKTLNKNEIQDILNKNPSYVFFRKTANSAITSSGMSAIEGRSIATDSHFFPKGALAFLDVDEPVFFSDKSDEIIRWENKPRFVFDHDTGGAIRGGGRVDLFLGQGDLAAKVAGTMKGAGHLYYLFPR